MNMKSEQADRAHIERELLDWFESFVQRRKREPTVRQIDRAAKRIVRKLATEDAFMNATQEK